MFSLTNYSVIFRNLFFVRAAFVGSPDPSQPDFRSFLAQSNVTSFRQARAKRLAWHQWLMRSYSVHNSFKDSSNGRQILVTFLRYDKYRNSSTAAAARELANTLFHNNARHREAPGILPFQGEIAPTQQRTGARQISAVPLSLVARPHPDCFCRSGIRPVPDWHPPGSAASS